MQRLEVSCAVRPIYGSLGAKGLKKFLSALAIVIISWQDVTLLKCQGVWNKTCTQLSLSQILIQNPKNYSLWDVQRFCYN
jgi:hypothetical protein